MVHEMGVIRNVPTHKKKRYRNYRTTNASSKKTFAKTAKTTGRFLIFAIYILYT